MSEHLALRPRSRSRRLRSGRHIDRTMYALTAGYVASSAAGTTIAIRSGASARFAGLDLASDDITRDFLVGAGTALSAPLVMIVAFVGLLALTTTRHRARVLPLVASAGALFAIGQLGEPIVGKTLTSPALDPATTCVVVANILLPSVICLLAARS